MPTFDCPTCGQPLPPDTLSCPQHGLTATYTLEGFLLDKTLFPEGTQVENNPFSESTQIGTSNPFQESTKIESNPFSESTRIIPAQTGGNTRTHQWNTPTSSKTQKIETPSPEDLGETQDAATKSLKEATQRPGVFVLQEGIKLGEYSIREKLGEGGMGEVWRAEHSSFPNGVALKILSSRALLQHAVSVARFIQEARTINKIRHRNLVQIYSFGEELPDGRPYYVMEFLRGCSLAEHLERHPSLSFDEIDEIFAQICRGLGAAHNHGIIHRDLKPDNIFLVPQGSRDFLVKILDFGIAKLADPELAHKLTQTGTTVGTAGYMAPEQIEGNKALDPRADIYSLGVILFEMIAGKNPFRNFGDSLFSVLTRQMAPPPTVSSMSPGREIPPDLDQLLMRALSKYIDKRPARCSDFYVEFVAAIKDKLPKSTEAAPAQAPAPVAVASASQEIFVPPQEIILPPSAPKNKALLIGVGGAFLLGVLIMLGVSFFSSSEDPKTAAPVVSAPKQEDPKIPTSTNAPVEPSTSMMPFAINSKPPGAKVYLDDKLLEGTTPLEKEVPYGHKVLSVRIEKEGFATWKGEWIPIAPFQDVIALQPSEKAAIAKATELYQAGKFEDAIDEAKKAKTKNSGTFAKNIETFSNLYTSVKDKYSAGQREAIYSDLKKAINADNSIAGAYQRELLNLLGPCADAQSKKLYDLAIAKKPTDYTILKDAYTTAKEAINYSKGAPKNSPGIVSSIETDASNKRAAAEAAEKKGKTEEAIKYYEAIMQMMPGSSSAYKDASKAKERLRKK